MMDLDLEIKSEIIEYEYTKNHSENIREIKFIQKDIDRCQIDLNDNKNQMYVHFTCLRINWQIKNYISKLNVM